MDRMQSNVGVVALVVNMAQICLSLIFILVFWNDHVTMELLNLMELVVMRLIKT